MSVRALIGVISTLILAGLIVGAALYVRQQPSEAGSNVDQARPPDQYAKEPIVEVEHFAPEHYEGGRPSWKVKLAHLAVEKGGQTITAGRLREGLIYDRKGRPAVRVTADRVKYDTVTYNFDVAGRVRVVSPKGAVITTEMLHWDNKSRALTAPGQVMLRTEDEVTVVTSGLRFDTATQTVYCPNQIRMRTARSDAVGRNLEYNLETGAFVLRDLQMVIDIQEAKERTGRTS